MNKLTSKFKIFEQKCMMTYIKLKIYCNMPIGSKFATKSDIHLLDNLSNKNGNKKDHKSQIIINDMLQNLYFFKWLRNDSKAFFGHNYMYNVGIHVVHDYDKKNWRKGMYMTSLYGLNHWYTEYSECFDDYFLKLNNIFTKDQNKKIAIVKIIDENNLDFVATSNLSDDEIRTKKINVIKIIDLF